MAVQEVQVTQVRAEASRVAIPGWLKWGALIGLAQIFAMLTVAPLGVSTAYPQMVGFLVDKVVPGFAESQPYLQEIGAKIGWEVMLVFGMFLGALLAHLLTRRALGYQPQMVTAPVLVKGFEGSRAKRIGRAFLGGFLILFGARLANGCTTGHMLSGIAQMAVSGFLFGMVAFGTGVLVARLLYREGKGGV
ncbi:MAG: YeeE/YedE family protein [Armatimonadetes bacterium]|nr:YeeE/YedE family protein [Armatimonadota bacterium]